MTKQMRAPDIVFITAKSDTGSLVHTDGQVGFLLLAFRMTQPTG